MSVDRDPSSRCVPLVLNGDVVMSRCRPGQAQEELSRMAAADEVLVIHRGVGSLDTMFGPLPFKPFDYIVIPRCTTYRLEFDRAIQPDLLVIEASNSIVIPPRYLNPDGQIRLGAPYSERDFHGPQETLVVESESDTPRLIKDCERR